MTLLDSMAALSAEIQKISDAIGASIIDPMWDLLRSLKAIWHEGHADEFRAMSHARRIVHIAAIGAYMAHRDEWWLR